MKSLKFYILIFTLSLFSAGYAQHNSNKSRKDMKQEIKKQRVAFINRQAQLTQEEAALFWPIYEDYKKKKSELRRPQKTVEKRIAEGLSVDYSYANNLLLKEKSSDATFFSDYITQLRKILSEEKIYKVMKAEKEFKRVLLDRVGEKK